MSHAARRQDDDPDGDRDGEGIRKAGAMSFLEHLDELRTRLIRSVVAIVTGMIVAYAFKERIADLLLEPIERALPAGSPIIATRPGEIFSFYLDIALIGGIVLAAPAVMYQVWRFIAPALYAKEKKLAIPFVLLASAGTACGVLFNMYLLFPAMMQFFGGFSSPHITLTPRIEDTFDQFLQTTLGMVIVFQMPTLAVFLTRMRVVTAGLLWKRIKYAVLVIFVAAAVLTPSPDPWNQLVFAAPMLGLYLVSILLAWIVSPRGPAPDSGTTHLRLVIAAAVLDQARQARPWRGGASPFRIVSHTPSR